MPQRQKFSILSHVLCFWVFPHFELKHKMYILQTVIICTRIKGAVYDLYLTADLYEGLKI